MSNNINPNLAQELGDDEDNLVDAEQLNTGKKINDHRSYSKSGGANNGETNADTLSQASVSQDSMGPDNNTTNNKPHPAESSNKTATTSTSHVHGDILNDPAARASKLESSIKSQLVHLNETTNYARLKAVKMNKSKRCVYPIDASAFAAFEASLFDLLGFAADQSFKLPEINANGDLRRLSSLTRHDVVKAQLLGDMAVLKEHIELNASNQVQLKREVVGVVGRGEQKRRVSIDSPDALSRIELRPKLATVILNQAAGVRPRKCMRILLTRRNTASLDSVLNELTYLFRLEAPLKRIYKLNGEQIVESQELLFNDSVFLVVGNDKLVNKDLELDIEEIKLVYANELMKSNSNLNPELLREKHITLRKLSALNRESQSKLHMIEDTTVEKNEIDTMPDDLLENYEIGSIVGEGHYAVVRECKDISTGFKFALKAIDLKKLVGKEHMIETELKILLKAKHPNIVKLVEEYRSKNYVYMIFEYYKGGDLLEVTKRTKFEENDVIPMIYSLASAISYLHSMQIVHRDIKLENILIQEHPDGRKSLRLGDFGLAAFATEPLTQKCGSIIYVAPEILNGNEYGVEVDIWSLGIIAYILICGYAPFQGHTDEETMRSIQSNELRFSKQDWAKASQSAKDLISKMLDRNQQTRIKIDDILSDRWFTDYKKLHQQQHESIDDESDSFDVRPQSTHSKSDRLQSPKSTNSQKKPAEVNKSILNQRLKNKNYQQSNILTPRIGADE